jgi:hypothetical protein
MSKSIINGSGKKRKPIKYDKQKSQAQVSKLDLYNDISTVNGEDNTGIMESFAYNDFLLSGTEEFSPR